MCATTKMPNRDSLGPKWDTAPSRFSCIQFRRFALGLFAVPSHKRINAPVPHLPPHDSSRPSPPTRNHTFGALTVLLTHTNTTTNKRTFSTTTSRAMSSRIGLVATLVAALASARSEGLPPCPYETVGKKSQTIPGSKVTNFGKSPHLSLVRQCQHDHCTEFGVRGRGWDSTKGARTQRWIRELMCDGASVPHAHAQSLSP